MKKNKIEGVQPFNDFFYKSCYYHQLIAGLACLGIDKENILINSFVSIKEDFVTINDGLFDEKNLAKYIGYKDIRSYGSRKKFIRWIDKHRPIVTGVDCYYLESRPETYLKRHDPHFVLVYGYDLDKDELNIVDHNYMNSHEYIEKVVSFKNIIIANKMFKRGIQNRKYTCHVLKPIRQKKTFDIWDYIDKKWIDENKLNSKKNLEILLNLILTDLEAIKEKADQITRYLQDLKTYYFILSKAKFFSNDEKKHNDISLLISGYSNLLSLFWKMKAQNNYEYAQRKQESIIRKVEEIKVLESKVYDYLLEVYK